MVIKANTKLIRVGGAAYLLIPKDVFIDSAFPFKFGNGLSVEIKGKGLIISKNDKT